MSECVSLTLTCGFTPWVSSPPYLLCTLSCRCFPVHGWDFRVQAALSLQTWGSPEKLHRLPSVEHSTFAPALLNADPSSPVSTHSYQPYMAA